MRSPEIVTAKAKREIVSFPMPPNDFDWQRLHAASGFSARRYSYGATPMASSPSSSQSPSMGMVSR